VRGKAKPVMLWKPFFVVIPRRIERRWTWLERVERCVIIWGWGFSDTYYRLSGSCIEPEDELYLRKKREYTKGVC
jgi:hypothetical protein